MAAEVVNEMDRKTRNPLRIVPRWLWLTVGVTLAAAGTIAGINAAASPDCWGLRGVLLGADAVPAWVIVLGLTIGLSALAAVRRTRRPAAFIVFLIVAAFLVVNLGGCFRSGGGVGGWFNSAFGGGGGGATGSTDDGGGALPSLWGSAARSFARIDWWLGLGSGISVLTGVYRLLRGDVPGGVLAVAVGIGLALVTLIVGIIFPLVFPIIAFLTFAVGGIVAYRLATGRGIGGHTLKCLWARVVAGSAAHRKAHKVRKA